VNWSTKWRSSSKQIVENKHFKKEGCTSFDQRLEENHGTLVYSSDEVVLEKSDKIPNQVDMLINVEIDPLSIPTSLILFLLERLRELQLEVISVESNVQPFNLEAHLLITQKYNLSLICS
jgi:hypothetical protein